MKRENEALKPRIEPIESEKGLEGTRPQPTPPCGYANCEL